MSLSNYFLIGALYQESSSMITKRLAAAITFWKELRKSAVPPKRNPIDAVRRMTCLGDQPFVSNR